MQGKNSHETNPFTYEERSFSNQEPYEEEETGSDHNQQTSSHLRLRLLQQ
jgi:hypothetical protein